jgi:hypothetical protein
VPDFFSSFWRENGHAQSTLLFDRRSMYNTGISRSEWHSITNLRNFWWQCYVPASTAEVFAVSWHGHFVCFPTIMIRTDTAILKQLNKGTENTFKYSYAQKKLLFSATSLTAEVKEHQSISRNTNYKRMKAFWLLRPQHSQTAILAHDTWGTTTKIITS